MVVSGDVGKVQRGLHVYTAGTSLQETVILVFVGLSIIFSHRLSREDIGKDIKLAKKLTVVLWVALALIAVSSRMLLHRYILINQYRVCFRIIEFAAPHDSALNHTINTHEYFIYIFDIVPMFLALFVFNVYHPGKTLQGPDSEYPKSNRQKKKQAKAQKKAAKSSRSESAIEMV